MMKTLTALAAAGAIGIAAVAAPAPAQARNEGAIAGAAIGGLAAGAIIGSAVAPRYDYGYYAAEPVYGGPYAYGSCYTVRQKVWTDYGPRWRRVRVCD
jgi:hypothetical protein